MDQEILSRLRYRNRSARGHYTSNGGNYQIMYEGSRDDVFGLIGSIDYSELDPGGAFPIESADPAQVDGPVWSVTLNYSGSIGGVGGDNRPKMHNLSISTLQLPLSTLSKYLLKWEYYLFAPDNVEFVPNWWDEAKSLEEIPVSDRNIYRYSKNLDFLNSLQPVDGVGWQMAAWPEKPGVKTRTVFVYQITEFGRYRKESSTEWAVVEAGQITDKLKLGDFGIVNKLGGNWRNWGGTITQNKDGFDAAVTYKHMPGSGWDPDLVEAINAGT